MNNFKLQTLLASIHFTESSFSSFELTISSNCIVFSFIFIHFSNPNYSIIQLKRSNKIKPLVPSITRHKSNIHSLLFWIKYPLKYVTRFTASIPRKADHFFIRTKSGPNKPENRCSPSHRANI